MTLASAGDLAAELLDRGVRRVHSYAWRDLDDPEVGGSELHADEILGRWAALGLDIHHRTSTFDEPRTITRRGYSVRQEGGRVGALARTPWHAWLHDRRAADAVIDIWNGIPWWSPVWFRGPTVTWMHHVHGPMWAQSFPPTIAIAGRITEERIAPRVYRNRRVVTLAPDTRDELEQLGIRGARVDVIPPGISPMFSPDAARRSPDPLVVAVGRLAPVKRYPDLIAACAQARSEVPNLRLEILGDGPDRSAIESAIDHQGAHAWCTLRGRVRDDDLVDAYRRAWIAASASVAEGWGMVLTEAAACGTPSVVTDVSGHRAAVVDGQSGVIVGSLTDLGPTIAQVVRDQALLDRLGEGALKRADELTWDATASRHLEVLLDEVRRSAPRRRRRSTR